MPRCGRRSCVTPGSAVPEYGAGWRTVMLGWLAKRFGPAFVLPTIAGLESKIGADYSRHPGPEAAAMVAESQSHARLFNQLAKTSPGLQGNAVAASRVGIARRAATRCAPACWAPTTGWCRCSAW